MQPSSFGFKNTALLITLCLFLSVGFISLVQADGTITYEYDDLGRLESVEYDGGGDVTTSDYDYDEVGNRETKTVTIAEAVSDTAYSISDENEDEGNTLTFSVTRTGDAVGEETIDYATSSGSATQGTDFTSSSGTLTFAINDTVKTFDVLTTDDSDAEDDETLTATLSNLVDGDTIADSTGTGTIDDDDAVSTSVYTINNDSATEGGNLGFTVTRTGTPNGSETIDYDTANGTASSSSDYTSKSGTLTFGVNDDTKAVTISTTEDAVVESTEAMYVNLTNQSAGTIGDSQGTGTIYDDDAVSTSVYTINNKTATEGNSMTFTVSRSGTPLVTETISYGTTNGSASSSTDYYSKSGSLTFLTNTSSKTVTVSTKEDVVDENTETFYMDLSNQSAGSIGDSRGNGTIYDDDDPIVITNTSGVVQSGSSSLYMTDDDCFYAPFPVNQTICLTWWIKLKASGTPVVTVGYQGTTLATGYSHVSGRSYEVDAHLHGDEP